MVQAPPKSEPRLVTLDIETSKTIYGCYPSKKPQYLSHKDIIQDWFAICAAWKWVGEKPIHTVSLLDDRERYTKSHTDDYHVVKTLHAVLSSADAVIGHNVDKFDWGKLLERFMCHRLPPVDKPKMIDTMKMAKQACFSYNNLDYLCKRLGTSAQKRENGGNEMWMDILQGKDPDARIKECLLYCVGDIPTAEELYLLMAPYMPTKMLLNQNLWRHEDAQGCPYCKSQKYSKEGTRTTTVGLFDRFHCNSCGHYFTSGITTIKATFR